MEVFSEDSRAFYKAAWLSEKWWQDCDTALKINLFETVENCYHFSLDCWTSGYSSWGESLLPNGSAELKFAHICKVVDTEIPNKALLVWKLWDHFKQSKMDVHCLRSFTALLCWLFLLILWLFVGHLQHLLCIRMSLISHLYKYIKLVLQLLLNYY